MRISGQNFIAGKPPTEVPIPDENQPDPAPRESPQPTDPMPDSPSPEFPMPADLPEDPAGNPLD